MMFKSAMNKSFFKLKLKPRRTKVFFRMAKLLRRIALNHLTMLKFSKTLKIQPNHSTLGPSQSETLTT